MTIRDGVYKCCEWLLEKVYDTGWIDLPLGEGIQPYSPENTPQYRKIGNIVYIRGAVKGVTESNMTIGILPEGFRPGMASPYVQNTSLTSAAVFSRCIVSGNGQLRIEYLSEGGSFGADKWFPIETSFLVD